MTAIAGSSTLTAVSPDKQSGRGKELEEGAMNLYTQQGKP